MNMENFKGYSKCACGAVTLFTGDGRSYSCKLRNLRKFAPFIDLRKLERYTQSVCCDHCVNHYGMDLCACGSGEPFGKCGNHLPECDKPMQILGGYYRVIAKSSWLA